MPHARSRRSSNLLNRVAIARLTLVGLAVGSASATGCGSSHRSSSDETETAAVEAPIVECEEYATTLRACLVQEGVPTDPADQLVARLPALRTADASHRTAARTACTHDLQTLRASCR
jgi:hypothetical protein